MIYGYARALTDAQASAEGERRSIIDCSARGRADAKVKDVRFCYKRPPPRQRQVPAQLGESSTPRNIARSYEASQATIFRVSPSGAPNG